MQDNFPILSSMAMEYKISQMEIFIKDIISMENLMEQVNTIGKINHSIEVSLLMDSEKAKDNG